MWRECVFVCCVKRLKIASALLIMEDSRVERLGSFVDVVPSFFIAYSTLYRFKSSEKSYAIMCLPIHVIFL